MGAIYGFCVLCFGTGNALGPWLGGIVFDNLGNYAIALAIAIFSISLASIAFWYAAPRKIRIVVGKTAN